MDPAGLERELRLHPTVLEKDGAGPGSISGSSNRSLPVLWGKVAVRTRLRPARDPLNRGKRDGKIGIELKF